MKVYKLILFSISLFIGVTEANAQSLRYAKSLIENEQYLEAAKQLRPLADGGNAEAQYLAATLFFEGKGVNKSDQQGYKYATMAAEQCYEEAINLLLEKGGTTKMYDIAKHYCDKFPSLKKGKVGITLSMCYLKGLGVEQDLMQGTDLLEQNDNYEATLADPKSAKLYWDGKMQLADKKCMEDYADYLYGKKAKALYEKVTAYIFDVLYEGKNEPLEGNSNKGIGWAMAEKANRLYNKGNADLALVWATKAKDAGSALGKDIYNKITYVPQTYSIYRTSSSTSSSTDVLKFVQGYDYTTVYFRYHQRGYNNWVATGQDTYLVCRGKKYKLIGTSLPMLPVRKTVRPGEQVDYYWKFERIPDNATEFTIYENGDRYGFKIGN